MAVKVSGIEWDDGNRAKCQKHGLSISDIDYALLHGIDFVFRDHRHSIIEGRYIAIGKTKAERSVFIAFTVRPAEDNAIYLRPVSARYMQEREKNKYEETVQKIAVLQKR